jgi:hypothetical protein
LGGGFGGHILISLHRHQGLHSSKRSPITSYLYSGTDWPTDSHPRGTNL